MTSLKNNIAFISSADSKYFPLLLEWLHSIKRFPQSKNMDICILDVGMSEDELNFLRPQVTTIAKAEWPAKIPAWRIRGRDYIKACVNRPFLKNYFPGYELYFWMDSDVWVQNWKGVEMFLEGGRRKKIAVTAQNDRAYPKGMRVKWIGNWPWKVRGFYFSNACKAFGRKTARELFPYYVLLAGAFCLHRDAPHWDKWQELILKALKKGKPFTAEQLTLGVMVHLEGYPVEILPAWIHWLSEFKPLWDEERGVFVEPFLPHEELSMLHLSGNNIMRFDRSQADDFKTTTGETVYISYRYPHYDGERRVDIIPDTREAIDPRVPIAKKAGI